MCTYLSKCHTWEETDSYKQFNNMSQNEYASDYKHKYLYCGLLHPYIITVTNGKMADY